jgi:hypothetical protein
LLLRLFFYSCHLQLHKNVYGGYSFCHSASLALRRQLVLLWYRRALVVFSSRHHRLVPHKLHVLYLLNQESCSSSVLPNPVHTLEKLGSSNSFPALSCPESVDVDDMLVAHCDTFHAMCSCFVMTSNSCRRSSQMILYQCPCNFKNDIVDAESYINLHRWFLAATVSQREIYYIPCLIERTSPMWLIYFTERCFRIVELVVYAAFMMSEQCKILSTCGVSLHLSFHQLKFLVHLLSVALHCHLHLIHDYVAISHKKCLQVYWMLLLCYFVFSYGLRLELFFWNPSSQGLTSRAPPRSKFICETKISASPRSLAVDTSKNKGD